MFIRHFAQARSRLHSGFDALRDDIGASVAIEYAFVAPLFFALILASLETALVFFAQQGLETTAETAARLILTGQAQNNFTGNGTQTSQQQFQAAACAALPPFLQCSRLNVYVQTVNSYAAATADFTPTYNSNGTLNTASQTTYTPGTQGAIVVVRLMYVWPTLAGPAGFTLVNYGASSRLLVATSVMRTEGYTG